MGEVGELCEIFQWRGKIDDFSGFRSGDKTHLGEELADVFIYNTRLADLCGIDLTVAIRHQIEKRTISSVSHESCREGHKSQIHFRTPDSSRLQQNPSCSRASLALKDCARAVAVSHFSPPLSLPRHAVLAVSASAGAVCALVLKREEGECARGLSSWPTDDISLLATGLADIACHLISLGGLAHLDMGECIRDKLAKNAAKYPVHLVKGSSAKYTAYTHALQRQGDADSDTAKVKETTGNRQYGALVRRVASFSLVSMLALWQCSIQKRE